MQRRVSHHRNCRSLRLISRRRQELHVVHTPDSRTRHVHERPGRTRWRAAEGAMESCRGRERERASVPLHGHVHGDHLRTKTTGLNCSRVEQQSPIHTGIQSHLGPTTRLPGEVRDIFHAGEGSSGGPGCPRTALTITSSRRAVPRRCRTTRDIRAHLWARCTGAATGGTSSILPCLFVAEALDREWSRGRGTRLHCRRSVSVPRVLLGRR
jgi:hypothetical protein